MFISLFSFSVYADEKIDVSNQEEYFDAIATINSSNEENFIVSLSDDIILTSYPTTSNPVLISNDKNVTVIGNNHKIKISETGSYGYHSIMSVGSATVNLGNSDGSDTLYIQGGGANVSTSESLINVAGTVNIYDGVTISDNYSGPAALAGAAFRVQTNGTLNMYGGVIKDTSITSTGVGGAIALDYNNATFNMYGGEIKDNQTNGWGAAVYASNGASINIKGGKICGNKGVYGGAISSIAGPVNIENATFEKNEGSYGGAILIYSTSTLTINNTTFKENSSGYGGAILSWGESGTINNSKFESNEGSTGGAIRIESGTLTSTNNKYIKNEASYGGAIFSRSNIISSGDDINSNKASVGAGVYLYSGSADLEKADVYNNKAETQANDYYISANVTSLKIKDASTINKSVTYGEGTTNIIGWFKDESDNRFSLTNTTDIVEYSTITAGNSYSLTAAGNQVFEVKFEGVDIDTQFISSGGKITRPENPTKENYKFIDWYIDREYNTKYNFDSEVTLNVTLYPKWKYDYKITFGANQKFNDQDLVIKTNGVLANLISVKVNDEELDSSNYILESGSTILTLKKEYLSSLKPGTYKLTFVYNDDNLETTFIINGSGDSSINNPDTKDNIYVYMYLLGLSIFGLCGMTVYKRKFN